MRYFIFVYRSIVVSTVILGGFFVSLVFTIFFRQIFSASSEKNNLLKTKLQLFIVHWFCRLAAYGLGLKIDSGDFHKIEKSFTSRPKLILANHLSFIDVIAIGATVKTLFLSKKQVSEWPVIGSMARNIGMMFVDRDDVDSRVSCLRQMRKQLEKSNVTVFPEGTTSASIYPLVDEWKAGNIWAAEQNQGTELLAFSINYEFPNENAWVDEMDFVSQMSKTMFRKSTRMKLTCTMLNTSQLYQSSTREKAKLVYEKIKENCIDNQQKGFKHSSHQIGERFIRRLS